MPAPQAFNPLTAPGIRVAVALLGVAIATSLATAQLRIVSYNTAEGSDASLLTVFRAIGEDTRNGIAKPIDILALQEQTTPATTTQAIVDLLNSHYGAGTYARGTLVGVTQGAGRPGIIYNTQTVQLVAENAASNVSSVGAARQTLRYRLRPIGYDSTADFYLYNSHYKAENTTADADRRNVEATQVRANADALGEGVNLIYVGDFNVYSSNEPMYQTLRSAGAGRAVDPLNVSNATQSWSNSSTWASLHTQSPCTSATGNCGVGGGVDDRFDFQLMSDEVFDGEGFAFIPGSYRPFGNNGSTFNQSINAGSNTVTFPGVTSFTKAQVLSALHTSTDHLPVVADYQVPAVMSVAFGSTPSRVIRGGAGSSVAMSVGVTNTAVVVVAAGADNLDFVTTTSGSLTGSFSGSALALGPPIAGNVGLPIATAGSFSGTVTVDATSNATRDGLATRGVNWTVVDRANASFASASDANSLTIDFGARTVGETVAPVAFTLANLAAVSGFTASLDLDSISGMGATGVLTSSLAAFSGLAAGSSLGFTASISTAAVGLYSATYTLNLSDENLLNAGTESLTLTLQGQVVAPSLAGDYTGDGRVDAADYTAWRDTLGSTTELAADGDASGVIDAPDYDVWVTNYGDSAASSTAVPEPAAATLVLAAIGFAVRRGRQPASRFRRLSGEPRRR
jgi:hypothetical protein